MVQNKEKICDHLVSYIFPIFLSVLDFTTSAELLPPKAELDPKTTFQIPFAVLLATHCCATARDRLLGGRMPALCLAKHSGFCAGLHMNMHNCPSTQGPHAQWCCVFLEQYLHLRRLQRPRKFSPTGFNSKWWESTGRWDRRAWRSPILRMRMG